MAVGLCYAVIELGEAPVILRCLLASLALLLPACAYAQFNPGADAGNVKVRITFSDGRAINFQVRVQLMEAASSTPVTETFTNNSGMAEFSRVRVGSYHVVVTGDAIETTDSGELEVDSRKVSQAVYISVKARGEDDRAAAKPGAPMISAVDLNVPDNARQEFDKASEFIGKQNWSKALEKLDKAIALYPNYASAYNNKGVALGRLGKRAEEREAFLKAVSLNDHFADAFTNLARMDIVDRNFPEAETLLGKATASDPANPTTMILLANVQLLNRHYDEAIANCKKVHSGPQESHALVHYIAARAFEHENRPADARTELQTFLREEPGGERADAVRKELAGVESAAKF
jgi:tetratricopeptide (TPR) repeat protein